MSLADECRKLLDQWNDEAELGRPFPSLKLTKIIVGMTHALAAHDAREAAAERLAEACEEISTHGNDTHPCEHASITWCRAHIEKTARDALAAWRQSAPPV